jgi:hypothetical protein
LAIPRSINSLSKSAIPDVYSPDPTNARDPEFLFTNAEYKKFPVSNYGCLEIPLFPEEKLLI